MLHDVFTMTAPPVQRGALESALSDTELTKTATVESFRTVSRAALALTALGCTQSFLSSGLLLVGRRSPSCSGTTASTVSCAR